MKNVLLLALALTSPAFGKPGTVTHLHLTDHGTLDVREMEYNVQQIRIGCPQLDAGLTNTRKEKMLARRTEGLAGLTSYCIFAYAQSGSSGTIKIDGFAAFDKKDWELSYQGSGKQFSELLMEIVEMISRLPENTGPSPRRPVDSEPPHDPGLR